MDARTYILLFVMLLCGCRDHITEVVVLSPKEIWQSHGLRNYSMEQTRFCFCVEGGTRMVVTVLNDTVFSVVRARDSVTLFEPSARYYLSIDSLFGLIANTQADSMVVTYDGKFGYPTMIDIDPQLNPVDGGVKYVTNNLKPIAAKAVR